MDTPVGRASAEEPEDEEADDECSFEHEDPGPKPSIVTRPVQPPGAARDADVQDREER